MKSSKLKGHLNVLFISDIHLGHSRNKTHEIIANLKKCITSKTLHDVDILFIAGDLFDKLLVYPADEVAQIEVWFCRLLVMCKEKDVMIRILEGTPLHDRKQASVLCRAHKDENIKLKYVDNLSIEYIPEFDINVLYIPDEWRVDPADTWDDVVKLMTDLGIDKVDLSIMHGMFEHQVPNNIKSIKTHTRKNYEDITKYFINIGHVHTSSVLNRTIANGSFDRLAQNEEEPKGFFKVSIKIDNVDDSVVKFVENKTAKIFKAIILDIEEESTSLDQLHVDLSKLPDDSYIEFRVTKERLGYKKAIIKSIADQHPNINISHKTIDEKREVKLVDNEKDVSLTNLELIPINNRTIIDLVKEKLLALGHDKKQVSSVINELKQLT